MTPRVANPGDASWYYYGVDFPARSATWTSAHSFRSYWGVINGIGGKKAKSMYTFTAAELQNHSYEYKYLLGLCQVGDNM